MTGSATCDPSRFQCASGACVSAHWVCDGDNDCKDNSDEVNCPARNCSAQQFQCLLTRECIPINYKCDGAYDCEDFSDERPITVCGKG